MNLFLVKIKLNIIRQKSNFVTQQFKNYDNGFNGNDG
jgi:hypothetical protein